MHRATECEPRWLVAPRVQQRSWCRRQVAPLTTEQTPRQVRGWGRSLMGSSALSAIRPRMTHVPAPAERPPVPPVGPDRKIDVDGLKPAVQSRRRHPLLRGALTGLVYTQPSGMEPTTCEGSAWCVSSPSVQRLDVGRRGVCKHSRLQYSLPPMKVGPSAR